MRSEVEVEATSVVAMVVLGRRKRTLVVRGKEGGKAAPAAAGRGIVLPLLFASTLLETGFFPSHVRKANVGMPLPYCTTLLDSF
jgi:hypothetical protein